MRSSAVTHDSLRRQHGAVSMSCAMTESNLPAALLQLLEPRLPQMLSLLRSFVVAESPSLEKSPADRCCSILAEEWRKHGTRVQRIAQKHRGDHLRITWQPHKSRSAGQLLVLGHYDTVYATGTLAKMPFRVSAGKVRSEEHTSELQSLRHLVCRLLLEKKKTEGNCH